MLKKRFVVKGLLNRPVNNNLLKCVKEDKCLEGLLKWPFT